ncbi:Hypothetical predicted protein, partial [Paramuricea clavata]
GEIVEPTDPTGKTETPLLYFKRFVTQEMIELIVDYTNRYSVQKQGKCVNTSAKEIEQVLGMYFKMGLVEMPSIRMYREKETRYPPVTEVMSRNRFQLLLSLVHFVDNETGEKVEIKEQMCLGIGGDVVAKLCGTLLKDVGHKIYADNFFTSVELIEKLSEDEFLYAGTVRKNRLAKCNVLEENALKKKGRGSHDFRVESKTNTMCVR